MLDFRRNSRIPNYLGAKHQRRLLVTLALAGVAAIVVLQARHLGTGNWFASRNAAAGGPADTGRPQRAADGDVARAQLDRQAFFPGLRVDYLEAIEDDTVFRAAEADAWFHLLALLKKTDQLDLDRASLGAVGYLQLDQQADEYRGRLVTVRGTLRGAKLVPAPPNDHAIEQYYQLWLQPELSSPALVAVYALSLPEGVPLGAKLEVPCVATGFFFKRWAYPSAEGVATAPLLLARGVAWQPPPPVAVAPAPPAEQFLWALGTALVLAVLVVGFFVARERAAGRLTPTAADGKKLQAVLSSQPTERQVDRGDVSRDET